MDQSSSASRSHKRMKINSYTVSFKVEAVEASRIHPVHNITAIARKYGIDRKRLREWDKNYNKFLDNHSGKGKKKRKLHQGADVLNAELEIAVLDFFENERSEGRVVRNKDLQEKALEIGGRLDLPTFKASKHWLSRWKRRWGIGMRRATNCSQKIPADYHDQLKHFRLSIFRLN